MLESRCLCVLCLYRFPMSTVLTISWLIFLRMDLYVWALSFLLVSFPRLSLHAYVLILPKIKYFRWVCWLKMGTPRMIWGSQLMTLCWPRSNCQPLYFPLSVWCLISIPLLRIHYLDNENILGIQFHLVLITIFIWSLLICACLWFFGCAVMALAISRKFSFAYLHSVGECSSRMVLLRGRTWLWLSCLQWVRSRSVPSRILARSRSCTICYYMLCLVSSVFWTNILIV